MPEPSWSCRPLQSLIRQRGSRRAGFPTPGTVLVLAEHPTHPVFPALSMPKEATPWAILSWGSALLHGVSQSPRPQPLGWGHLSWGSSPLQRIRWRESTSLAVTRSSHPGAPGLAASSHAAGFGVAHRFSQPPSGFLFPPPSCHFQTGGAPGVLPFRGFISSLAALAARRRQHALMTFFLQVAHPPFLGGGTSRHDDRYLGSSGRRLWSSSGPSSAWESVRTIKPRLMSRWSTCPSWASPPHGLYLPLVGKASAPRPSRFTSLGSVAGSSSRCAPRLATCGGESSLTRGLSHLEVSRLRPAPPFRDRQRWLIRLAAYSPLPVTPLAGLHGHPRAASLP